MENLANYSESFKMKFERFLIGCDSIEEIDKWNKEENGEMDVFYSNEIINVILKLIAADGIISEREVEYINDIFGFDYSIAELETICSDYSAEIDKLFNSEMSNGISNMEKINVKLADAYKELLTLICDIVMESDGKIDKAEIAVAERMKEILSESQKQ